MNTRQTKILTLLIIIFALPIVASWLLYFNPEWLPDKRNNHGILIQPPLQLSDLTLVNDSGKYLRLRDLRGRWTLLVYSSESCRLNCQEQIRKVQQIRRAVGEDYGYLGQPLIVRYGELQPENEHTTSETLNEVFLIAEKNSALEILEGVFENVGVPMENSINIADPMGNLMMLYPADVPAIDILADIKHLLKTFRH